MNGTTRVGASVRVVRRTAGLLVGTLALALAPTGAPAVGTSSPALPAAATDGVLAYRVGALMMDPSVRAAAVGAEVRVADSGTLVFSRNPTTALMPASDTKLFTSAAAMHRLGPDFRFHTDALGGAVNGGVLSTPIYLKGYGDPTTLTSDYAALAAAVRAKGITSIPGGIRADATYFEATQYSPYWSPDYANDYYAAKCSPLTVSPDTDYDAGTVIVKAVPAAAAGGAPSVQLVPAEAGGYIRLAPNVRTVAAGLSSYLVVSRQPGSTTVTVTGQVAVGNTAGVKEWITVPEPALYAAAVFRAQLARAGVSVGATTAAAGTPAGLSVLATDTSMTVAQLLVPFLKLSNNTHADALTKTMAARATGAPGTWATGTALIKAYATGLGVDMTGTTLVDGSGLTRYNKVTARQLATLLVAVQREAWFSTWYDALPIAGLPGKFVGGTLASRMAGTYAVGNVHAKNGYLTGVTSLSGYATGRDGRRYVFAMITNHSGATTRPIENALGVLLAGWNATTGQTG